MKKGSWIQPGSPSSLAGPVRPFHLPPGPLHSAAHAPRGSLHLFRTRHSTASALHTARVMRKSPLMVTRRPPESKSTERNAPSVEAAFQAAPEEMVAEILDGELHLSPRPARPHANVASNLGILIGGPFKFGRGG